MKCDKCFFCTHIGAGIYAPYPLKYCKYYGTYKAPFIYTQDHGGIERQLDFRNIKDCKIWHDVGCNIHPSRVAKAKRDFVSEMRREKNADSD